VRLLNRTAGRISRHRRGRFAGFILMLLGLVAAGGLYTLFTPAQATQAESDTALVAKGRELFIQGCAYCHGLNGEGKQRVSGTNYGPPLVGAGAAAVDFQVGTGRMPMARPDAQAPRKPVVYSEEDIAALAAYVASLGPGPAIPDGSEYSTDGLSDEELEAAVTRGGQIFLTNCTACHNFEGSGGAMPNGGYAPTIRGVESKYIYEAMLTGPSNMDVFSNGNLSPDEKRDVIAYLKSLEENPGYGGFSLGGLGPVSEGMFAWLFGIGGLVGFAVWIAAHTTRASKNDTEEVNA
jgi:ubiquinol-cytochrome c reductase cytochrome c subunit